MSKLIVDARQYGELCEMHHASVCRAISRGHCLAGVVRVQRVCNSYAIFLEPDYFDADRVKQMMKDSNVPIRRK